MLYEPIVSTNIRLRYPEHFVVGEGSIVDDFCYFSTRVNIGRFCHIAPGCSIVGGVERLFALGDFSGIVTGSKIFCTTDHFTDDIISIIPHNLLGSGKKLTTGDVFFERLTGLGANSVVMPKNHIPEGVAIGALSFVPSEYAFRPWTVYAGIPIRPIKPRNRDSVMRQVEKIESEYAHLAEGKSWS